jgi:hypothetical protein
MLSRYGAHMHGTAHIMSKGPKAQIEKTDGHAGERFLIQIVSNKKWIS